MRRSATFLLLIVLSPGGILVTRAAAQDVSQCYGFSRDRSGNIREGICVGSRDNLVFGTREHINRSCESLIICGGTGDLGDCHLARNVCKGMAASACDAAGFDVFNGPAIQNAACRARAGTCSEGPEGDRALCSEIRTLISVVLAPPTASAVPATPGAAVTAVASAPRLRFRLPVEDAAIIDIGDSMLQNLHKGPVHVDHDPATRDGSGGAACRDYLGRGGLIGLPHCYGGHKGTDYVLRDGFARMDRDPNFIVAAADGEVVEAKDHLYDRCHGTLINEQRRPGISCDGQMPPAPDGTFEANVIRIRHADGFETRYFHIKRGSALVRAGQRVACGTRIASIGSSGWSYGPHVHFELRRDGQVLDPYAGPLSQAESFWVAQGPAATGIPAARCQ